jgi:hypothetical protein
MSFSASKNLIFLLDSKNNFKFLVDSGALLSILPHSSPAPPTGLHLVGANGKQIPAWGFRRHTVCFSSQTFEFDFLLVAMATPLLGMDFLAKFEFSIFPPNSRSYTRTRAALSPRQVRILSLAPGTLRPPPPLPLSRHRYSNCSRNFHRYMAPMPLPSTPWRCASH